MVPRMSGWFARVVKNLFGPGKPPATSDALMVGSAKGVGPVEEKSVLSLALERAKAPDLSPLKAGSPLLLDTLSSERGREDDASEAVEGAAVKAPPKKRAVRKRKVASPPPSDPSPEEEIAPALTFHEPEADVWVSDAVAWSLSGRWSADEEMWSPPPGSEAPKRLEEFREKAAEGKLVIWGRAGEVGMWEPIEAAYWRSCGIEQFSFLEGREKVFTEPKTAAKAKPGKAKAAAKYTALKANRRQVEEVWQPGMMH